MFLTVGMITVQDVLIPPTSNGKQNTDTVFLRSDAAANFFSLLAFVRLLFEGGDYFFRKPTYINNGWISYGDDC